VESKEEAILRAALRLKMARILYKNDTIQNETLFHMLTTTIFEHRHVRSGTGKQWTFPGAFYFSTLVVTLIGNLFFINFILNQRELFRLWTYDTKDKYVLFYFKKKNNLFLLFSGWENLLYGLYSCWRVSIKEYNLIVI
jgi:hypothetical protein